MAYDKKIHGGLSIVQLSRLIAKGEFGMSELPEATRKAVAAQLNDKNSESHKAFMAEVGDNKTVLDEAIKLGEMSTKDMETYQAKLEKKIARGELTEKLSVGAQILLGAGQVAAAATQIGKSNRALRGLRRPAAPGLPQIDPALDQAITDASRGTFDASRAAAIPAREIRNRRLLDEMQARQVAGGQSAQYAALNQASAMGTNRAYAEMIPMIDSIRAREQARLDNLIATRQQQRQQDFQNRMSVYQNDLNNYNMDAQAAGALGATGRENLYTGFSTLANSLPVAGGYLADKTLGTGIKDIDTFTNRANQNLIKATTPDYNLRQSALSQLAPNLGYAPKLPIQVDPRIDNTSYSQYKYGY